MRCRNWLIISPSSSCDRHWSYVGITFELMMLILISLNFHAFSKCCFSWDAMLIAQFNLNESQGVISCVYVGLVSFNLVILTDYVMTFLYSVSHVIPSWLLQFSRNALKKRSDIYKCLESIQLRVYLLAFISVILWRIGIGLDWFTDRRIPLLNSSYVLYTFHVCY